MNKIHRTVWNEARQCFVVASETAKARGKASSTRTATAQAVASALLALGGLGAENALAVGCMTLPIVGTTVTIGSGTNAEGCFLTPANATIVVNSGGNIFNGTSGGVLPIALSSNVTGGITNSGTIAAHNLGNATITNYAVVLNPSNTLTGDVLNNTSAMIEGQYALFLYSNAKIAGKISNAGTIRGTQSEAINLDSAHVTQGLTNAGLINAPNNVHVVRLSGYSTLSGGLTNTGNISASGTGYAIYVEANSTITKTNGTAIFSAKSPNNPFPIGTIVGDIFNAGTITNTGNYTGIALSSSATPMGGLTNSGTISSSWIGTHVYKTSLTGSIENSNTIAGVPTSLMVTSANIAGGIQNIHPGVLSASANTTWAVAVSLSRLTVTGGITNSGTISAVGGKPSLKIVNPGAGSGGIVVSGSNTAKFIGPVVAASTPMTVASSQTYTADNGNDFTVSGFTTAGTLGVAAGGTATVTGNYTQASSGTFRVNATNSSSPGNLTVTGTASLPSNAKFDLVTGNASTCGGITAGGTIAGVLKSGGAMTSSTFAAVTDDCTGFDFTAVYNSGTSAIDLVASAAAVTWTVTGGSNGNGTVSCASPVNDNATATCTGTASGGYYLASAAGSSTLCGTINVSGNTITAGPVTAVCTVTGTFALTAVNGTCSGANGTTVTSAPAASCSAGTPSSVSTGNTAYSWTCAGIGAGTPASCSATRNYVVSSSAGANGSISASQNVAYNATPSFTVTANSGYTIQSVTGCSGTLTAGTYTTGAIIANCAVSASFVANVTPTFVGATTTLTVAQGASATDIKSLLHASDSDASQTLTWTQSSAPSHGTLTITSAAASSGSTDVTPGGTITYQPTAGYAGTDSFTVQVSDGTASATRTINVTVSSPTVTVSALTLNTMTVGTAFVSQSFAGAGGYGAYTYTVSAGALPAGLLLNASTGALTGTPTTAGSYSFTIQATDSSTPTAFSGTRAFSGTVLPATVTQTSIPTSSSGVTATLAATGCSGINSAVFVTAPAGAPVNTTFPFGLLDFRLTGCSGSSVSVTVTYSQNLPTNAVFYKENNGSYTQYPTTAIGANSVTFSLIDGGAGDADGVADGNIHDPSGVGVSAAVAGAPQAIPTLSEWGLIFLSSLMAMFGLRLARRRRVDE